MRHRYIMLLLILLLSSGCTAVYNLELKDDTFNEKITINSDEKNIPYFKNNSFYAIIDGASNFKKYDKKIKNNVINLSYKYDGLEYNKATALSSCFEAYNVIKEDNYYIISTSKGFNCATEEDTVLLDSIKIEIKTNHKVKDNNADEVKGYHYIWNLNKNNYKDKKIYVKLYKDKYVFNYENEFYKKLALYILIVCVIISSGMYIFVKFIRKRKISNKI